MVSCEEKKRAQTEWQVSPKLKCQEHQHELLRTFPSAAGQGPGELCCEERVSRRR